MMPKPKSLEETRRFASMVAEKQGWNVNPDESFTDILLEGLTTNWNRYGYYLCPCRDTEGSREADASVLCPCRYAHADIKDYGRCFCALYMSPEFIESGSPVEGIPDRRYS